MDGSVKKFDIASLAPENVRAIAAYVPGKPIAETARELGLEESSILKMASNENPLGPSPRAIAAIGKALADLNYYPDGSGYDLKAKLSAKLGVRPENIVLGNGSNDVLELVARAFLRREDSVVYSRHAFMVLALHRFNTPTALRWLNGVIGVMTHSGLPKDTAVRMFRAIGYYLNGGMLDETAGYSRGASTVEPVPEDVMLRDYPEVVAAGRWFAEPERRKTFELGLKTLLDGIEREISQKV